MATVRVELNSSAVKALLRSEDVRAELERRARQIAAAAGPGHRVEVQTGPNRVRAAVITDDREAMAAEARDRNLTRSLDAGRG